jgi:hypothetical protein
MKKIYTINDLFAEAYNTAINNVITTVNKLGWNWSYYDNWRDAHALAEEMHTTFDCNGEYAN